ncbi:MAG: hypothetical protein IAE67_05115 [Candidatus Competibacteraceae bacterium]|nr:hypothetical protein [Candidatus Competibacteraceae bacterium]
MKNDKTPYLSVVMAVRNDKHRSDLSERLNIALRVWSELCSDYTLPIEILLVEWNPLPQMPSLQSIIKSGYHNPYTNIRIISVPNEIHCKIDPKNPEGFHQMIAKNTGIRRAKGLFVLCTNLDVFPDKMLIEILSKQQLKSKTYYRTRRCDIPSEKLLNMSVEELISYSRKHIIRSLGMHPKWPGLKVYKKQYLVYKFSVLKWIYPFLLFIKRLLLGKFHFNLATIDKEASGDFTLMSHAGWMQIKGYLENTEYPLHIDSLALIHANYCNFKQIILPPEACVYHMDHPGSWREENKDDKKNVSHLSWEDVTKIAAGLQKGDFIYNTDKWGLADDNLYDDKLK